MKNIKNIILDLPIAKKFIFGFGIIFLFIIFFIIYSFHIFDLINDRAAEEAKISEIIYIANDLKASTLENIVLLSEYNDIYDYQLLSRIEDNQTEINQNVKKLRQMTKLPEVLLHLNSFELLFEPKAKLANQIIDAVNRKIDVKVIDVIRHQREALDDESLSYLNRINEVEKNEFNKAMQTHAVLRENLWKTSIALIMLFLALTFITLYVIARSITRSVQAISAMVQEIINGNFAISLPVKSDDELGRLMKFLNTMAEKLQQTHQMMSKITYDLQLKLVKEKEAWSLLEEQTIKMEQLAYYDHVTGLYNRFFFDKLFLASIEALKQKNSKAALFLIDIKSFRAINETLGLKLADVLLKEVASRLMTAKKPNDILAHLLGNTFAMLLYDVKDVADAEKMADYFHEVFEQPFLFDIYSITVNIVIGIVLYPKLGDTATDVMKEAELALHKARLLDVNKVIFSKLLLDEKRNLLQIETIIRNAISKKQFSIYYQPIVKSMDGSLCGIEALLRWEPILFPKNLDNEEIVKIAEETGLIVPLGNAIIENALMQYNALGLNDRQKIKMSINLSTKQIIQKNFIDWINGVLTRIKIDPSQIVFEITETAMVKDIVVTIDNLNKLNEIGCGIHMDDFGTGYASLNLIKNLPISGIKIDKSLVQTAPYDVKNAALVEMIFVMAETIGAEVISEGVETEVQFDFIKALAPNQKIQGYFFSTPISMAEIIKRYLT